MAYGYVKNDQGFEALNGLNTAEMLPPTSTVVPLAVASIATWLGPGDDLDHPVATQLPQQDGWCSLSARCRGSPPENPGTSRQEQVHAPVPLGTW